MVTLEVHSVPVSNCDNCPLESTGSCQHPEAKGDQCHINSTVEREGNTPVWCPLRKRSLELYLED